MLLVLKTKGARSQGMKVASRSENDPWLAASKEMETSVQQVQRLNSAYLPPQ